ncbi:hypothetical protein ACFFRR_009534 [Megaselia abdita]
MPADDFKLYFEKLLNLEGSQCTYSLAFQYIQNELLDGDITREEIFTALEKLKEGKATGEDRISYEFFKKVTSRTSSHEFGNFNVAGYYQKITHLFGLVLGYPTEGAVCSHLH